MGSLGNESMPTWILYGFDFGLVDAILSLLPRSWNDSVESGKLLPFHSSVVPSRSEDSPASSLGVFQDQDQEFFWALLRIQIRRIPCCWGLPGLPREYLFSCRTLRPGTQCYCCHCLSPLQQQVSSDLAVPDWCLSPSESVLGWWTQRDRVSAGFARVTRVRPGFAGPIPKWVFT